MKERKDDGTYRDPHVEPHGYAAGARYLPDDMPEQCWYTPVPRGLEVGIAEKLAWLRGLDEGALREQHDSSTNK